MLHESCHGYIISADEAAVILSGIGCKDMRGLPAPANAIDKERQLRAIRRLCEKNILEWERNKYRLKPPFNEVFTGMKDCRRAVTMISKNYPGQGFVCYAFECGLAVWEASLYRADMLTLYYTDAENFIGMMSDDGFIPDIPEYCGGIPEGFDEEIGEAYRRLRQGDGSGRVRIAFAAVTRDTDLREETEVFAVSCSVYGSVITQMKGDVIENRSFDKTQFIGQIEKLLKCED